MTIITDRLDLLDTLELGKGSHESWESGACVLEAVAYIAGEEWSDHPECASPVLATFLRIWNDSSGDDQRQELKRYIPRLVGSKGTTEQELVRGWMAADWLIRDCVPRSLDVVPALAPHAVALRACAPITDAASLDAARPVLTAARAEASASWDAAWDAARDAAWAAAGDAARDAAWDAARAAAWDAARDAAGDAARERLSDFVSESRTSAHALVDRMLAVTESRA